MAKGGKLNQRKIHAAGNNQQEEILALKREVRSGLVCLNS
jgi:hypothetical protein